MWINSNQIPIQTLKNKDFLLFKFRCGLCQTENRIACIDFDINFFLRNDDLPIKKNLPCPYCDKSNYHDLEIKLIDRNILSINVESEGFFFEPTPVDQTSFSYSLDENETVDSTIELLLELDAIEELLGVHPYKLFKTSIEDLKLLCLTKEAQQNKLLRKMIYSNTITILETYISQVISSATYCDKNVLINIVEKCNIFETKKIECKNIYKALDSIKTDVLKILKHKVFHNIEFVTPLFIKGMGINISPKIGAIGSYVKVRHDIVHRNGKTKDGESLRIQNEDINNVIRDIENLVEFIESEILRLEISIGNFN